MRCFAVYVDVLTPEGEDGLLRGKEKESLGEQAARLLCANVTLFVFQLLDTV